MDLAWIPAGVIVDASFLSRFSGVKPAGQEQWSARCPAHQDRKQSLSIGVGADDRILLTCHAGCPLSAILAALGLSETDLFRPKEVVARAALGPIVATYDYRALDGTLLYQVTRHDPKDFRQRRPDGHGGWIRNLDGVPRVPYRWPELRQHEAVVIVEGEKDAETAARMGLPSTTNAGGAGKWGAEESRCLKEIGVLKATVIPDNDVPGRRGAQLTLEYLAAVGILGKLVPVPGKDLTASVLSGFTKAQLLERIKSEPVWSAAASEPIRQFERLEEGHYRWSVLPPGVMFEIDHLRRAHNELIGELSVRCDFAQPHQVLDDGTLLVGNLNISSLSQRKTWAKELQARAETIDKDPDWFRLVDNFCNHVGRAEQEGEPVVALTGIRRSLTVSNWYTVDGLTLHQRLPNVIFGWGGVGKSFIALYCAGCLARQGVRVLYIDGEMDQYEHDERLALLFGIGAITGLSYLRLDNLALKRDYVKRTIQQLGIQYLVLDSISKLANGKLEESDTAKTYIGALDSFGLGSVSIAHITKGAQTGEIRPRDQHIYGAAQWDHFFRHAWFVKGDGNMPNDPGGAVLGFYLTKSNTEAKTGISIGLRLETAGDRATVTPCDLVSNEELGKHEPTKARLVALLTEQRRNMTYEQAGAELGIKPDTVKKTVLRHPELFRRLDRGEQAVEIGLKV